MSEIDNIVADEQVLMTCALIRAFLIHDCNPTCHCCGIKIEAGMEFKLAFVKTVGDWYIEYTIKDSYKTQEPEDEMLCINCSVDDLMKYKEKCFLKDGNNFFKKVNAGFTRKHK